MKQTRKIAPLLILVVVFAVGVLAGVGGTVEYMEKKRDERREHWRAENEKERSLSGEDRFFYRLQRDLKLSDAQVAAIKSDEDVLKTFGEIRTLNETMRPKVRAAFGARMEAMKPHLTAEQIGKLDSMRERQHGDRNRGGPSGGRGW